jgi:hypothetical protein
VPSASLLKFQRTVSYDPMVKLGVANGHIGKKAEAALSQT